MNIDYYLINPTENITLLVETPVPRELQPFVASELLRREKRGEQVGFIEQNSEFDICVRMAGGEFCGNAALSAASLYLKNNAHKSDISVCLSGTPLCVKVNEEKDAKFKFSAILKNNTQIEDIFFEYNGKEHNFPIVLLGGISHIIAEKPLADFDPEKVIKKICKSINASALGIMMFDSVENTLTPLVFVPEGDTLYWEKSCASGTIALGAYLFRKTSERVSINVNEPGGTLGITADKNTLILSGNAVAEYKKQADISILQFHL